MLSSSAAFLLVRGQTWGPASQFGGLLWCDFSTSGEVDLANKVSEISVSAVSQDGAFREGRWDVIMCMKYMPVHVYDALDGWEIPVEVCGEGSAFVGGLGFVCE